jgi:Uma2 family endonuclease
VKKIDRRKVMSDALMAEEEILVTSYEDYLVIEDRVEVIDGVVYGMAAPTTMHQRVSRRMVSQLEVQLEGKRCEPFEAPTDVKLPSPYKKAGFTMVQPDVFVVCEPSKVEERYINGAPDFIIEILSPSTRKKDLIEKLNKYGEAGVKEYWMIDIEARIITQVLFLEGGFNKTTFVDAVGKVPIQTLAGLYIDFDRVFAGFPAEHDEAPLTEESE